VDAVVRRKAVFEPGGTIFLQAAMGHGDKMLEQAFSCALCSA
jgi:hypothetical protein